MFFSLLLLNIHFVFLLRVTTVGTKPEGVGEMKRYKGDLEAVEFFLERGKCGQSGPIPFHVIRQAGRNLNLTRRSF